MIFVTTGTHEDPFDRLVRAVDQLKRHRLIQQEVFIQTGYSTYQPDSCLYRDFIPFGEMMRYMTQAEMVITHGGTGSIMLVLYHHKIPIVVPRQRKYHEHIDDHQVLFCQTMVSKGKILAAYETDQLEHLITHYPSLALPLQSGEKEGIEKRPENLPINCMRFARDCLHINHK